MKHFMNVLIIITKHPLVNWLRGSDGMSVFDRQTFPVMRSRCSWQMTTYVGDLSAVGQPTRPTQPSILSG